MYPPITLADGSVNVSFSECREQIRFFLTYFDRVKAVGMNHVFGPAGMINLASEELQDLVHRSIISSISPRHVNFAVPGPDYLTADIESVYFGQNSGSDPVWAVAPPRDMISGSATGSINALTLDMLNVLPVPDTGVSIEEVIGFRDENIETLRLLHQRIDEIFAGNYDNPKLALSRMCEPVQDIENYLKKFKFPYFKAKFSVSQFVSASFLEVLFGLVGSAFGIPFGIGSKAAGLFNFTFQDISLARPENSFPKDFQYVFRGRSLDLLCPKLNSYNVQPNIRMPLHTRCVFQCGFPKEKVPERQIDMAGSMSFGNMQR